MLDKLKEQQLDNLIHQSWDILDKSGMPLTGFTQVNNKVIRIIIAECGITAALLYVILLSHRNIKTNDCFPTREVLAKEINKDIKTVARNIKLLSDGGYIIVNSGNSRMANEYYFPFEESYETEESNNKHHRAIKSKSSSTSIKQAPIKKTVPVNEDPDSDEFDF